MGWILFGEVEAQVLIVKQSKKNGSAGVGAGLCLLGTLNDHCLFSLGMGMLQREAGTSQSLKLFCR